MAMFGGRRWIWLRVALLAYLVYVDARALADSESWNLFGGLTLGVHELGHVLFSPFGEWLSVAGGSITQLAAPLAAAVVLARQADWYGVGIVGTWEAYSLTNLATYVGDASAQELPLVGLSDEPMHDWNYLLGHADLLSHDIAFARLLRVIAVLTLLASTALAAWALLLVRSHGDDRLDPAAGAGGHQAGQGGHAEEHQCHGDQGRNVGRADLEQHRPQQAVHGEGADKPE
jgi:hypothetical protein